MIWPGLPAFLVQLALGLCRPLPVHLPAWCSFGGIIAPTPTNMGKEGYPYALMVCEDPGLYDGGSCVLYLFSGVPTVEENAFKAWDTDLNVMVYRARGNVWKKESAFTLTLGDSTAAQYTNFVWSNFDLYSLDSALLLSASDPLPATDYATTLFEGDVATAVEDYIITNPGTGQQYPYTLNGAHAVIADSAMLDSYGLLRITVDEVPVGYKIQSLMLGDYAGNLWLTDAEQKDTGGGFGVLSFGLTGETIFLTREPGTYHVKVEKIERRAQKKEPVAYLYNGVRLPGLPVTEFPYSAICCFMDTTYYLVVSTVKLNFKSVMNYWYFYPEEDGKLQSYQYIRNSNSWILLEHGENSVISTEFTAGSTCIAAVADEVIWANYDMKRDTGTDYISASEPVPVYE